MYHSLRVYHQVQQWRGVAFPPQDWGWKQVDGRLLPVRTDLTAAHASLPEIVKCNCKSDCGFQRCSCKKNMDRIAELHVKSVEDRVVRIPPHQILAKTMNKHHDPFWMYDKLVDISAPPPPPPHFHRNPPSAPSLISSIPLLCRGYQISREYDMHLGTRRIRKSINCPRLVIYIFFSCSTNILRGLSAYNR